MKQPIPEPVEVPIDLIMPFVSRARQQEGFDQMKESIREMGLKMPIGLRDISHLPAKERQREGGGHYKYQRIWGEGRILAHQELGKTKIWAIIGNMNEADVVGHFLTENINRTPLPWVEKAKLIKADLDAGLSEKDISKKLFISVKHVQKLARIINKTGEGLEEQVKRMSLNDAEVLTALPAEHQTIVLETIHEIGERDVRAIVRKAEEVTKTGQQLSKTALKKSIESVDDQLKKLRGRMKVLRLHHSLGPQNLSLLMADPKFRKAAEKEGISFKKFEAVTK